MGRESSRSIYGERHAQSRRFANIEQSLGDSIGMTYEQMVALDEGIDTPLPQDVVDSFPVKRYEGGGKPENAQCAICMEPIIKGDELRLISCGHEFHRSCVDRWFHQRSTCPFCRVNLLSE